MADKKSIVTEIKIKQTGDKDFKRLIKSIGGVEKRVKGIGNSLKGLRNIFFSVVGGFSLKQFADAADSIQLLSDRIQVFTGDAQETADTLNLLFSAAQGTNSSIDSLADTFNRVALATKELGLNTEELVGFTATLQNTFRLSGATAAEASGAAIQLSQGLASGQLRGQELRSVLEANAVIGGILADTLGTTRGQLIKFAESGRITSDVVINALSKNAQKLNQDASKLGQTFEQTLIKAFNFVKIAINNLNRDFKLNEKFAQGVEFVISRIEKLVLVITLGLIPALINTFKVIATFTKTNAIGLLISAFASFIVFFEDIVFFSKKAFIALDDFFLKIRKSINSFLVDVINDFNNSSLSKLFKIDAADLKKNIDNINKELKINKTEVNKLTKEYEKGKKPFGDYLDAFSKLGGVAINKSFINASDSIRFFNEQLKAGVITLEQYAFFERVIQEQELARKFDEGKISAKEYLFQITAIKDVNDNFTEKVFTALQIGATRYADSIGTITDQLSKGFEASFKKLEDVIFDSLKQGKFLFQDFAQFVIDELTRIAIRSQIIAPLAQALGFSGPNFTSPPVGSNIISDNTSSYISSVAAKGQVYSGGNQVAFANGGILNSPTFFPLNRGMGLAGEAGAEAVIPLTRTSDGDLGVKANPANVTVNVTNNAGVDVDVQSNQIGNDNILDITITRAVSNAISSGKLDRTMKTNYGVSRKGSR